MTTFWWWDDALAWANASAIDTGFKYRVQRVRLRGTVDSLVWGVRPS